MKILTEDKCSVVIVFHKVITTKPELLTNREGAESNTRVNTHPPHGATKNIANMLGNKTFWSGFWT